MPARSFQTLMIPFRSINICKTIYFKFSRILFNPKLLKEKFRQLKEIVTHTKKFILDSGKKILFVSVARADTYKIRLSGLLEGLVVHTGKHSTESDFSS